MADLNDLSIFVTKEELKAGNKIGFIDAGEIKTVDFSKKKDGSDERLVFQANIRLLPDGKEKKLTLNKTSQNSLAAKWGMDTERWIGKVAKISYVKQLAFGKMTDVLVLEPLDDETIPF